jgi:hypothetical protein
MPKCDQCNHISANPENLKTQNREHHVAVVYYGESMVFGERFIHQKIC